MYHFGIDWTKGVKGSATCVAFAHPYEDAQKFIYFASGEIVKNRFLSEV